MAPRPETLRRPNVLRIRVTPEEQDAADGAAAVAGLETAEWIRMVIRRAAIAELNAAGVHHGLWPAEPSPSPPDDGGEPKEPTS